MVGNGIVLLILVLTVGVVICGISMNSKSGFMFNNSMYQYSNPSVKKQAYYRSCVADECKDDAYNYNCLEKCRLKAYREGMMTNDVVDMVCANYKSDPDAYYRCLDEVYADYKYP